MLEKEKIEIPVKPEKDGSLIADLRVLREQILADRGGELIDVDKIIEEMRKERKTERS